MQVNEKGLSASVAFEEYGKAGTFQYRERIQTAIGFIVIQTRWDLCKVRDAQRGACQEYRK